jgi:hypothetical protein
MVFSSSSGQSDAVSTHGISRAAINVSLAVVLQSGYGE